MPGVLLVSKMYRAVTGAGVAPLLTQEVMLEVPGHFSGAATIW